MQSCEYTKNNVLNGQVLCELLIELKKVHKENEECDLITGQAQLSHPALAAPPALAWSLLCSSHHPWSPVCYPAPCPPFVFFRPTAPLEEPALLPWKSVWDPRIHSWGSSSTRANPCLQCVSNPVPGRPGQQHPSEKVRGLTLTLSHNQ